jgi:hypothetical protein
MIHRCNKPLGVEGGYRICNEPASHFDSRVLPHRFLYCEQHRASDDPPIQLLDTIRAGWNGGAT